MVRVLSLAKTRLSNNIDDVTSGKNLTLQSSKVVRLYKDICVEVVLLDKCVVLIVNLEVELNNIALVCEEVVREDSASSISLVGVSLDKLNSVALLNGLILSLASVCVESCIVLRSVLSLILCSRDIKLRKLVVVGSHNAQLSERTVEFDVDRLRTIEVLCLVGCSKCITLLVHCVPAVIYECNVLKVISVVIVALHLSSIYNICPNNKLVVTVRNKANRE